MRSIFGWSYPPGAENDPYAPYNQDSEPCAVCGRDDMECECPECPVCGEVGYPDCWVHHMCRSADGLEVVRRLQPGELAPPPPLMAYQSWGDAYEFRIRGDGAKWGPSDWYDDLEAALREALASGKNFDTGWYSAKKEIVTARIRRDFPTLYVEVSCSDDFDTMGYGTTEASGAVTIDQLRDLVDKAHRQAEHDRRDNACYVGYCVGHRDGDKRRDWVRTYLVDAVGLDAPTGDNYSEWGWQEDRPEDMPEDIERQLAEGMGDYEPTVIAGEWIATAWEQSDV